MRKSSLFWLLLLIAWIAAGVYFCHKYLCGTSGDTVGAVDEKREDTNQVANIAQLGAWTYADGNLKFKGDEHIRFNRSDFRHLTPLADVTSNGLQKTATYLKDHPDRSLAITGYYNKDEKNTSIHPNLGLARANNIKNALVKLGAPSQQLSTIGKLLPADWFKGDILRKGIDFSFNKFAVATDRLDAIKARLLGKPLTLYFATGQDNINLTSQQRTDFSDLIYYLDNVASSNLQIGGHTDNQGNKKFNYDLSDKRAKFVKDYLSRNGGISGNRMSSKGFGPDKPVDTNATEAGRKKNRRVEVTLN